MSSRCGLWLRCFYFGPMTVAAAFMLLAGGVAAETPVPGPRPAHQHEMTPQMLAEIRKFAPQFESISDEALAVMLKMMPPNYEWYLSEQGFRKDTGVLVVTHGFSTEGDAIFSASLDSVASEYPTAVAYGMAMMTSVHIQDSIDDLVAAGAKTVVVVPATQSEFDTGIRQYRYIVGDRDEPAYMAVPQVRTSASIIVTPPLADHELTTAILLDNAREISENEPDEVVIILGHGPADTADNTREMAMVQVHVDRIQSASEFADVWAINLQDDAAPEVRAANVQTLRKYVEDAHASGRQVLVIGFLLGTAGIQPKIVVDLEGLEYRFNPRGMSESPKFAAWVQEVVEQSTQ